VWQKLCLSRVAPPAPPFFLHLFLFTTTFLLIDQDVVVEVVRAVDEVCLLVLHVYLGPSLFSVGKFDSIVCECLRRG